MMRALDGRRCRSLNSPSHLEAMRASRSIDLPREPGQDFQG